MLHEKDTLDVIVPVYNEEQCLGELFKRLMALRERMSHVHMSFIFVNDGSSDGSLDILSALAASHGFVRVISFSRNFGHQMAVTAGVEHCNADYAAIIDADMQDPPEFIEDMYMKAKEGFDVVYATRLQRQGETWFKKLTAKTFYKFISMMSKTAIPRDTGDFRLISRDVVRALNRMGERHRFIRGMVPWVGFRSVPLYYKRDERYAGETKYPLRKMVRFALDAVFSFSNVPIRVATYSGLALVGMGVVGALLLVYLKFFTPYTVPGISAVIITSIMLGGFQIIMLGVIGEYIGRIFEESKRRPLYIIAKTMNMDGVENSGRR